MNRRPNFFFIGGMRCGSTTLNLMLEQHPNIFMSAIKEPNFYLPETIRRQTNPTNLELEELAVLEQSGKYRSVEAYANLFKDSAEARYVGESSHYIYHPHVVETIYKDCPEAKILVCLRNPAERLFSEYLLYLRRGEGQSDFKSFVGELTSDFLTGTITDKAMVPRLNKGLQYQLILPWLEKFGPENVKFVLFEDLERTPLDVAADIFSWLSIDPDFNPVVVHTQKGGMHKGKRFMKIFNTRSQVAARIKNVIPDITKKKLRSWLYAKSLERPEMEAETRLFLMDFYQDDIDKLQDLLDRNLEHWLKTHVHKNVG